MRYSLFLFLAFAVVYARGAELHGKVVNSSTGEPLGNVRISILNTSLSTKTKPDGSFDLHDVQEMPCTLRVDAVGFWLQNVAIDWKQEPAEFEIALTPQGARRTDHVDVRGDVFNLTDPAEVTQQNLTPSELKETSTVIAGDIFRAVQILPGVSPESNNDFVADFRVLGASFSEVGVYIDGILVRSPFHGIPNQLGSASIGILNDGNIDSLSLTPIGYSERYGDAIGGVLDARTREGSRERPLFTVGAGMAESHLSAEGGLDHGRGSWLLAGRRSYLGYLTKQFGGDNSIEPSFYDLDAKLTFSLTRRQTLDLTVIAGRSNFDQVYTGADNPNAIYAGESNTSLIRLNWRTEINPNLLLSAWGAFTGQESLGRNQQRLPLSYQTVSEWVGGSQMIWNWRPKQAFEAGYTARRMNGTQWNYYYVEQDTGRSGGSGVALRQGEYLQQSSTLFHDRLNVMGGVRVDTFSDVSVHPVSGQMSGAVRLTGSTRFLLGGGRYVQMPEPFQTSVPCGYPSEVDATSDQVMGGVEQRFGENTRVQVQGFARADRFEYGFRGGDAVVQSQLSGIFPSSCGAVEPSSFLPRYDNIRTHGVEIVLQRRSSNRLSGWISYTALRQRENSLFTGFLPPATYTPYAVSALGSGDQRNGVNAFATYRLRPTLNLSGKLAYGSGYPLQNGLPVVVYVDGEVKTATRMEPFLRLDLRADKAFTLFHQRVTFYAELLNATNHRNLRLLGAEFTPVPGSPSFALGEDRALQITPTVGFEWQF